MRILLTCDPMLPVPPRGYGGIERIVDALVRQYRQLGHTVGLLALAGSTCPANATFRWPVPRVRGRLATARNVLGLWRACGAFRPDLVHHFARLAYLLPVLPARVPKIMSYQRHTGPRPAARALRLARPGSLQFTGCSEFICNQGRPGGGDWTTVPNFVEAARFDFVPAVPAAAPLVFLSRVETIKGAALAIDIARAAGRRLLIAGNHATTGPEAEYWRSRIVPNLGHGDVEYVGEVDDEAKNRLLRSAAALLVPIQWDEPFGIVFVEAMATGTPVITCARGALPEIVQPGRTGYFIREVADGVEAVRRIPELDRRACREDVERRFSVAACADRYLELYKRRPGIGGTGRTQTHAGS